MEEVKGGHCIATKKVVRPKSILAATNHTSGFLP